MKAMLALIVLAGLSTQALAEDSCKVQATNKKLAGAALTSFTKKCERDAKTACQKASADKKLAGAAKTSFETKCVKDAVGQ